MAVKIAWRNWGIALISRNEYRSIVFIVDNNLLLIFTLTTSAQIRLVHESHNIMCSKDNIHFFQNLSVRTSGRCIMQLAKMGIDHIDPKIIELTADVFTSRTF